MQAKRQIQTTQTIESPKINQIKTRTRYENRPLTREQVQKLMLAVDNLRDATILHLGFNTGMRVSEIVGFGQDAIDWQQGQIKIWDEKKDKYRWIMPPLESLNKIKQWLNKSKPAGKPIFNFSKKTIERIIQKWCLKALELKRSWHCVRHTYISLNSEANQNIAVVITNTGDKPATILKYYTHLSPDYMRKQIEEKQIYKEG